MISHSLGRKITHKSLSEDELASVFEGYGIPKDYSRVLAELDTHIKEGKEEVMNDTVFKVTGKTPVKFGEFVGECVRKGVWKK